MSLWIGFDAWLLIGAATSLAYYFECRESILGELLRNGDNCEECGGDTTFGNALVLTAAFFLIALFWPIQAPRSVRLVKTKIRSFFKSKS